MLLHGQEVSQYYIIASLQRTGSYLLCESLEGTGVAGRPTEAIAPQTMGDLVREWGLPYPHDDKPCEYCLAEHPEINLAEFITKVVQNCTGDNGVFGFKIHYNQLEWIRKHYQRGEPMDAKILDYLFPDATYIRIGRKNNIRDQAISSYKAEYTQEWWKKTDTFNTQIINPDPPYNSEKIRRWERHFRKQEQRWDDYFAERNITPLYVEYDDLARDHWHETRRCLEYLGLDPNAVEGAAEPTLLKQADAVSRAWKRRLDEEDAARARKQK